MQLEILGAFLDNGRDDAIRHTDVKYSVPGKQKCENSGAETELSHSSASGKHLKRAGYPSTPPSDVGMSTFWMRSDAIYAMVVMASSSFGTRGGIS